METGKKPTWRRRILMVDKKWQKAVAARLILVAMGAVMLVQLFAIHFLTSEEALDMSSTEWSLAAVGVSASQLVVLFVALWRTSMRITHAVAGPAWVIERAIDSLREGKFDSRLTLRKGDYLQSVAAAARRLTEHLEQQQRNGARPASAAAPVAGAQAMEVAQTAGFSLIDTLIGTCLLIVGTLSCATLGMSCSNLQQRNEGYVTAHVIASDTMERLRAAAHLTDVYAQYSANPVTTVQGREVRVEFPEAAMNGVFGGAMDTTAALAAGFLPVQITVRSTKQNYVFTTFLGERTVP